MTSEEKMDALVDGMFVAGGEADGGTTREALEYLLGLDAEHAEALNHMLVGSIMAEDCLPIVRVSSAVRLGVELGISAERLRRGGDRA